MTPCIEPMRAREVLGDNRPREHQCRDGGHLARAIRPQIPVMLAVPFLISYIPGFAPMLQPAGR